MGNAAPATERTQDDLSDRDLARQLIDSKRKRAVQFAEPSSSVASPADTDSLSLHAPDLRSNLMRVQKDRDPLFYYEIIKVVGVGSMGSVAMVKKRDEVIGGSARKKLVHSFRREKQKNVCFKLPIVGDLFRHCFEAFDAIGVKNNTKQSQRSILSNDSMTTSFTGDDNTSVGSKKASVLYALKSIHLSRVGDQVFVEELKNEIEILKKLVSHDATDDNDDHDMDLISHL
jgi:serine/threonine protein kinase